MPNIINLYLHSRISQPLPSVYADILDNTGGVTRKGVDDTQHRIEVHPIYTAEASSECLEFAGDHTVLIDFHFVDFVLNLISSSEEEGERQTAGIMFTFYSQLLEQTLKYPNSEFQKGALLDYLVSRVTAETHYGFKSVKEHDAGRAEYVAKLVVAHEVAHAWICVDKDYQLQITSLLAADIEYLVSFMNSKVSSSNQSIFNSIKAVERLLEEFNSKGNLSEDLEEILCDYAMIKSAASVAVSTPQRKSKLFTYLSLTTCTMACLWAVPTLQRALLSLNNGEEINLNAGFLRDVRSPLGLIIFLITTGVVVNKDSQDNGGLIAELWEDVEDFDVACVNILNSIFSPDNCERLELIGECETKIGVCSSARDAILNLFGWR